MNKLLLFIFMLSTFIGLNAQTAPTDVCTYPVNYTFDQEVTWYFDLTGNSLVTPGQDLYFWSWEPAPLPGGSAIMNYEHSMLWSLTFVPETLYGVPAADIESAGSSAFWCTIQNATGSSVTGTLPYTLKEELRLGNQCNCLGEPSPSDNTFLVNFGSAPINNPDVNSNFWTNVETNNSTFSLLDINGDSRYDISASGNFTPNNNSDFTTPDPNLLGEMAVTEATQSYLYLSSTGTGTISMSCLDPARMYSLSIFGSRNTTSVRETKYTVTGAAVIEGILQTSGPGIATDPTLNCNDDEFFQVDVFPSAEGTIDIFTEVYSGGFGYINMLKIEEVTNPSIIPVTDISINTSNLSTSGPSQLSIDYLPVNTTQTGVTWTVNDETIALIDNEGNLMPIQEGIVTVTATSSFNSSLTDQVDVTFSNFIDELYITGTATESGTDLAVDALQMRPIEGENGSFTNQFELYTSLNSTGNISFFTATDGSGTEYGGDSSSNLIQGTGNPITPNSGGWKHILVDLNEMTYSISTIYGWNIVSNIIPTEVGQETWWGGVENLSTYEGNSIWSSTINFSEPTTADNSPRFYIELAGTGRAVKQIDGSTNSLVFVDQANNVSYTDINIFNGEYTITLDMYNYTYDISNTCSTIDDMKISIMGSSVAKGYGSSIAADDTSQYMGYAHQYDLLLQQRAIDGNGENWEFSNISIGGDTTIDLLNRFDFHLLTDCSKYVVYGLSLANEGLLSDGQTAYDQFSLNMQILIQEAINNGKVPIVMGNYANGYYDSTHYQFIKDMNLLIHSWDVPSINLLGTIDDGTGKWVSGYYTDSGHPNDLGYTEMMYGMVPSLFDALISGKPQPQLFTNTWSTLGNQENRKFVIYPEEQIHSYTTSIDFKTNGSGSILDLETVSSSGNITIDNISGAIIYNSPNGGQITSASIVDDNLWHTLTITHFYARGETILYVDANPEGTLSEQVVINKISINNSSSPDSTDYRNWFLYRSGMNNDEITSMVAGDLLKSSLEIYAPLDGQGITQNDELANLAQSTNTVVEETVTLGLEELNLNNLNLRVIPNPANLESYCNFYINKSGPIEIIIYDVVGHKVGGYLKSQNSPGEYQISFKDITYEPLDNGLYFCNLKTPTSETTVKIIIE